MLIARTPPESAIPNGRATNPISRLSGVRIARSGRARATTAVREPLHMSESTSGQSSENTDGTASEGPKRRAALLATLAMAQFMVVLDFTIVNVALPSIQDGLQLGSTTLQWLVSAYAVTFGGFLLLGGRLADLFGRARLYRIGLCIFVLASISGGLAVEPKLLIASRAVQGLGASMLAPAGLSLLITSWPDGGQRSHAEDLRRRRLGRLAAGAVIGGLLVEATWRLVFFVNVPVGIALFAASWRLLPVDPPRQSGQLDLVGALAATVGVAALVFGVTRAGDTLAPTQPAVAVGAGLLLLVAARPPRAQGGRARAQSRPAQGPGHPRRQRVPPCLRRATPVKCYW